MTSATLIKKANGMKSTKRTKSTNTKQSNNYRTTFITRLVLLITKFQQFAKQWLTNTIVCVSIIHFIIFYLISIVIDIVMNEQKSQIKMDCSCYVNRQFIMTEKELQYYYGKMLNQLTRIEKADPTKIQPLRIEDTVDFRSAPEFWVKYICDDMFKDYGMGYLLCDNSVCFMFLDATCLLLSHPGENNLRYVDINFKETFFSYDSCPNELEDKVNIMKSFAEKMNRSISKYKSRKEVSDLPYVIKHIELTYYRYIYLSNHTLQVLLDTGSTLILCPKNGSILFINSRNELTTHKLDLIERYGCTQELLFYLIFLSDYVSFLLNRSRKEIYYMFGIE